MTSPMTAKPKHQRLADIAAEYESKGYMVKVLPGPIDLPDFLSGFQPDLLLTGQGESVVVEVKNRDDLEDEREIVALEDALSNRAGWRLELVIDTRTADDRPLLDPNQIRVSLDEVNELQHQGHSVAAFLLLWSATEGLLRLLASREGVGLDSSAPDYVTKKLYTLGLLGRDQYNALEEGVKLRNVAVHGYRVPATQQSMVRIASVSRELLRELEPEAA